MVGLDSNKAYFALVQRTLSFGPNLRKDSADHFGIELWQVFLRGQQNSVSFSSMLLLSLKTSSGNAN